MRKLIYSIIIGSITLFSSVFSADGINKLQVWPVENSPANEAVMLQIVFPENDGFIRRYPINSQIRIESFTLGVMSRIYQQLGRVQNDPNGQTIHVVIDDLPYFKVTINNEDSSNANLSVYRKMLSFEVPYKLTPGKHIMRAFPVYSYNESIKLKNAFDIHEFYYKSKDSTVDFDTSKPFLTYNEPQGRYKIKKGDPILLDFYLSNASLSPDGYNVLLSIDDRVIQKIDKWRPFLIYGLEAGDHIVELELVNSSGERVKNAYNPIRRKINVAYKK